MRRNDREISNMEEIIEIIKKCDVCNIAFFDKEYPYIVPLNFGFFYDGTKLELYFHGANEGKKLSLIQNNPLVAFEMDCSHKLITNENASNCTMEYESVCGNGKIELLEESKKIAALTQLMKQYSNKSEFNFDSGALAAVTVFRLIVKQISGKRLKRS